MKKLDLNDYGVQEMNAEEMRVTEGGNIGEWLAGAWNWLSSHMSNGVISIDI